MSVRVLQGHVISVLEREPAGSVHAVVCSPPYWQLRAYGTPPQVWADGWVGELGQEPTPELYVDHLVAVFRAVRRVLRDDGTLWVNLAGCYFTDSGGQQGGTGNVSAKAIAAQSLKGPTTKGRHPVYKPLDYVDVPGLTARALQADGWLWRSDVALVKSAPMPESVSGTRWERCRVKAGRIRVADYERERQQVPAGWDVGQHPHDAVAGGRYDTAEKTMQEWADCPGCPRCSPNGGLVLRRGSGRPTRAWERLLVFAKRPGYYFDCEAVREPLSEHQQRYLSPGYAKPLQEGNANSGGGLRDRTGWVNNPAGRNARDWLLWRPQPLKAEGDEAEHYAAFPPMLPEVAVKAGTSARGCCPGCGAPWARVISTTQERLSVGGYGHMGRAEHGVDLRARDDLPVDRTRRIDTTLGWKQTCACPAHTPRPAVILDCFGGSGTSGIVADRLGRDAVLIELKPAYAKLAERRLHRDAPLLMWGQVTLEGASAPEADEEADGRTKQEQHPNRTVAGFNQRWKAATTRSVPEGVPLPLEHLEEPERAVAGG